MACRNVCKRIISEPLGQTANFFLIKSFDYQIIFEESMKIILMDRRIVILLQYEIYNNQYPAYIKLILKYRFNL